MQRIELNYGRGRLPVELPDEIELRVIRKRQMPVLPDPEVKLGDLEALQGVVKFPVRIKCATLSWNTLAQGLDEASA